MTNIIFNKFQPALGFDNEKHIYLADNRLIIEYYFNQDGYFEAIIIKQSGNIYIMDSNINGIVKRFSFTESDLYRYLQSDFRLQFALEYMNSYGKKRVLSRNNNDLENINTTKTSDDYGNNYGDDNTIESIIDKLNDSNEITEVSNSAFDDDD